MLVASNSSGDTNRYLVSTDELLLYGCPNCGCCRGYRFITVGSVSLWVCEKCGRECYACSETEWSSIPIDMGDIIDAIDKHPRRMLPCIGCSSCAEKATVIDAGNFVTPGCFVKGGDIGERDSLVIETSCEFAAQKIVSMFEAGAMTDGDDRVIIGAAREHQPKLNSLMLHIIRHKRIDAHTILQTQRS